MPRNVEIKARAADLEGQIRLAERFADAGPETIHQEDVFFACPEGRLKLRRFPDGRGELIYYERPDASGPKTSEYTIAPVERADPLRETLARAFGAVGVVRKVRTLFLAGRTRIHFDSVEGLGDFIELEVVLGPGEDESEGEATARELMERLRIAPEDLVEGAYIDRLRPPPA
ncbi:MAG: class IV adenylate cyclase [Candidatus Eisenbacteria bacterium]|nr:class IV adenylate cyclase [Candidatus Eisenbacteria bacterium]